jgi:hypothetical protein
MRQEKKLSTVSALSTLEATSCWKGVAGYIASAYWLRIHIADVVALCNASLYSIPRVVYSAENLNSSGG